MDALQRRLERRLAFVVALAAVTLTIPAAAPAAEPQGSIAVTLAGSGHVQSNPAGIDCGSGCTASSFAAGSKW